MTVAPAGTAPRTLTRAGGDGGAADPRPARRGLAALWLLALASASPASTGLAIDPTLACSLLDDQGLRVREGYRDAGHRVSQCATVDHPVPRGATGGDAIRFSATGTRGQVRRLQLELALRSRGDVRPALEAFASLADLLSARSLGHPLPTDARRAIATGLPGTWRTAGSELALERIAGAVPSLRFVIR